MVRWEAEAVYGTDAVDGCPVTVQGGAAAEDVVDVWDLLPAAEDHNPSLAGDTLPAFEVLEGETETDDRPIDLHAEFGVDRTKFGPVYTDDGNGRDAHEVP
jgi:hypothetical protein